MDTNKKIKWILRIAIFGVFFGHAMFALDGNPKWVGWIMNFGGWEKELATQLLFLVGLLDTFVAFAVLIKPIRIILLWAVIWTTWTAFMRVLPFIGDPVWDFVERWANIGAPLSLLLLMGWPKNWKEWLK